MQQSPRRLPRAVPAARHLPDPSRRGLRELPEPPAEPQPFPFLTHDAVQFGAQQLRGHLLKFPRPSRRHDGASLIEDSLAREIKPRWALRRTQQRPHRRERRSWLTFLHTIGVPARGTSQALSGVTFLALTTTRHRRHARDSRAGRGGHHALARSAAGALADTGDRTRTFLASPRSCHCPTAAPALRPLLAESG